jgi:Ca2+-binding RTX toxin-like protein
VTQTILVGIAAVNDAPTITSDANIATSEDTAISGQVAVSDVDGDALSFALAQGPANGTLTLDAATGQYTYTPAMNFGGSDSFRIEVIDASGARALQQINVAVAAVADTPALTVSDSLGNAATATTVALSIAALLGDTDGSETLAVTVAGLPAGAALSAGVANSDGTWTLAPADLAGLTMTLAQATDVTLSITAVAAEAGGSTASAAQTMRVTFNPPVTGGSSDDVITGGAGGDDLSGGEGNDAIDGGAGDDQVSGGQGNDTVLGGDGNDDLNGNSGNDAIDGGSGDDEIDGDSGNDVLAGGTGNDDVDGGSGDDTVMGGEGDDDLSGGQGYDTIDYSLSGSNGVRIDLHKDEVLKTNGSDNIKGFEGAIGTGADDWFSGDQFDNTFVGLDGNDYFRGRSGADTYTGSAGNDIFAFLAKDLKIGEAHQGVDVVTDFSAGDAIDLHDFVKGKTKVTDAVKLTAHEDGTMLSVKINGEFVDAVLLEGYENTSVQAMADSGMLIY